MLKDIWTLLTERTDFFAGLLLLYFLVLAVK